MSWRYVADNVHLFAINLRALQFVYEPLQFTDWIRAVNQKPPILIVAIIHVDRQNPETWSNQDRIKSAATHSMGHTGWQPKSPMLIEFVVQPRNTILFWHKGWWKTKKKK